MDNDLISKWNNIVNKKDKVYLLGDISFYSAEKTGEIISRLNGIKYLVIGNHDNESIEIYYKMGFYRVYDNPIIIDDFWILSHEPLYVNSNMPYANIFGHIHSNKSYRDFSDQSFCVCVERINYSPIDFDTIKHRMGVTK